MGKTYIKRTNITQDGEIIGESTAEFYNPFRDGQGYNFKYKSAMTKSYLEIALPYKDKNSDSGFTDVELGKIYRLSRHIYSNSNLLAKRSNSVIKPLTKDDIQAIIDLHRTKFNPFWNKMIEYSVIKEIELDGERYFCFNPIYFNSTTYMPLYLYIAFQEELNAYLPDWVIEKYLEMHERAKK